MRKAPLVAVALGSLLLGAATLPASADLDRRVSFQLIEVVATDTVVDLGAPGDSTGDLLTFHNRVTWNDGRLAGDDQGSCVRIHPASGTWECTFTVRLINGPRIGRLAIEGSYFDDGVSALAVTGGTGDFRHASGSMWIRAIDPTHLRFTFAFTV